MVPIRLMVDRAPMEPLRGFLFEHLAPRSRVKLLQKLRDRARCNGYRLEREIPMKGWAIGNRLTARNCEGARPVWYWDVYPVQRDPSAMAPKRLALPARAGVVRARPAR